MCLQKLMWDDKNATELGTLGFQLWCTGKVRRRNWVGIIVD